MLTVVQPAWADVSVEVGDDRLVTVVGSGPSLRATLEELCWQAGVTLRYEAADGAVSANVRDVPLETAVGTLLRDRSFTLATERMEAKGGPLRVRVLHVLPSATRGTPASVAAATPGRRRVVTVHPGDLARVTPVVGSPENPLSVPARLLQAAFGEGPSTERAAARRELVDGIVANPARRAAFLAADPTAVRQALAPYAHANEALREMAGSAALDPEARAKLRELMSEVVAP
jgi:hypothetical protein